MDNDLVPLKIASPLYLMSVTAECYSCGKGVTLSAIATRHLVDPAYDDPRALEGDTCLLSHIEEMPAEITAGVEAKLIRFSKTAGFEYLMTVCECGAHQGDHYVGKALFEAACNEPETIRIEKLLVEGAWSLRCSYSTSSAYNSLLALPLPS